VHEVGIVNARIYEFNSNFLILKGRLGKKYKHCHGRFA